MASESFRTGVRTHRISRIIVAVLAEEGEQSWECYLQTRELYNRQTPYVMVLTIGKYFKGDPRTQGVVKGRFH